MLDSFSYATIFQYSPNGNSEIAKKSKFLPGLIKGGRVESLRPAIIRIVSEYEELLSDFLNENVTLVPTPRSSLIQKGQLWPALEIAKLLESLNLGVLATCLQRVSRINRSSLYPAAYDRPSVKEQYDTMAVSDYIPTENITLIDDFMTLGRTTCGGTSRLAEKFPKATIRAFALVQTKGLKSNRDIKEIENVYTNVITYNPYTGKCTRHQD